MVENQTKMIMLYNGSKKKIMLYEFLPHLQNKL
jgi:hypothetical protein